MCSSSSGCSVVESLDCAFCACGWAAACSFVPSVVRPFFVTVFFSSLSVELPLTWVRLSTLLLPRFPGTVFFSSSESDDGSNALLSFLQLSDDVGRFASVLESG